MKTTKPLTHEIGVQALDGITGIVDDVVIEYVEQGKFAQMPGELVIKEQGTTTRNMNARPATATPKNGGRIRKPISLS